MSISRSARVHRDSCQALAAADWIRTHCSDVRAGIAMIDSTQWARSGKGVLLNYSYRREGRKRSDHEAPRRFSSLALNSNSFGACCLALSRDGTETALACCHVTANAMAPSP